MYKYILQKNKIKIEKLQDFLEKIGQPPKNFFLDLMSSKWLKKSIQKSPEITDGLPDVRAQISWYLRDIEGSNFTSHPL